ncbi:MAG TPA: glycosyltransferase, partial [Ktedonobacterales bacterium]
LARRLRTAPLDAVPPRSAFPSLSVLVPLKGADDATEAHLSSLVASILPCEVEYLFAVESSNDPAFAVCERVRLAHPELRVRIVLSGPAKGRMGKQHNLAAAAKAARYGIIACVDGDVRVAPGTLAVGMSHLARPDAGAVYFLSVYHGPGPAGGTLVALYANYSFCANFGALALTTRQPAIIGALWLLRRETLDQLGGFDQFTTTASDDAAIGQAIAALGLRCMLVPYTVTIPYERLDLRGGLRHLAKWIAMLRAEGLPAYALIAVTWHPLLWSVVALLVGLLAGGAGTLPLSLALAVVAALARVGGAALLNARSYGLPPWRLAPWLIPYELLAVPLLFGAGLFRRTIVWRGRRYRVGRHGAIQGVSELG